MQFRLCDSPRTLRLIRESGSVDGSGDPSYRRKKNSMANFKTHITTSTVLGVGYGATAHLAFGVPLDKCMLAAGLCSVAGMLPDLDSDSGIPVRESIAFGAAIVPMLMIDRFKHMGMSWDSMVLAGALIYIAIRFGVAEIFKRYTVHRGMWHSIPAALSAALLGYLICSCAETGLRLFKAGAVLLGFMSHLVLDEIYAVEWKGLRFRFKKSFGTAIKVWGNCWWANLSCYAKLILLVVVAFGDPVLMSRFENHVDHAHEEAKEVPHTARDWFSDVMDRGSDMFR